VEAVRVFRDTVLAAHPRGDYYRRLFYKHSVEGSMLLYAHPELAQQASGLAAEILPALKALVAHKKASLNQKTVADMLEFLEALEIYGSSPLRTDIRGLQQELAGGTLLQSFGIYLDQETDN